MKIQSLACNLLFLLASCTSIGFAGNWPAWRGPAGNGISPEKSVPSEWNEKKNVRWKIPLDSPGNSTPVVWDKKIFLTQSSGDGTRRSVICYDRGSGKQLWEAGATYAEKEESHKTNPQASASPVTDGEVVSAWFGSAGVYCYDMEGRELWRRDLGKQHHTWGYGSSPVLHENLVIVNFGPGTNAFLIALDKKTGKTVWRHEVPEIEPKERTDGFAGKGKGIIGSFSTPILIQVNGRPELVMSYPEQVRAFNPKTGAILWTCDGLNPLVYTSPIYGNGLVVAMGGYFGNALAVKPGGQGNVTDSHRVWLQKKHKSGIGTGVIYGDHIFLLSGSIVYCYDLKTGETIWSERVAGSGANSDSWSSMVLIGDRLYVPNQSSETVILRASPRFEKIGIHPLDGALSNSSLAVSDGEIFIRTHLHLWCISEKKEMAGTMDSRGL